MRRRRVHTDSEGRLLEAELQDHIFILRMDGHGVAHPAIAQDLDATLAAFSPVLDDVPRQDRTQLLYREWVIAADAFQRSDQRARSAWNGDPDFLCYMCGRTADQCRVGQSLRTDQRFRKRLNLAVAHEIRAFGLELAARFFRDRVVDDD